eukprot:gene52041-15235_t
MLLPLVSCAAAGYSIDRSQLPFVVRGPQGVVGVDSTVRGASGDTHFAEARAYGADAHGVAVSVGIWIPATADWYEECSDLTADARWVE